MVENIQVPGHNVYCATREHKYQGEIYKKNEIRGYGVATQKGRYQHEINSGTWLKGLRHGVCKFSSFYNSTNSFIFYRCLNDMDQWRLCYNHSLGIQAW